MTAGVWTTGMHRAAERFEAWREALNQSHLVWDLEPPASRHSTPVFVKSGWTVSVSSIVTATRAYGPPLLTILRRDTLRQSAS